MIDDARNYEREDSWYCTVVKNVMVLKTLRVWSKSSVTLNMLGWTVPGSNPGLGRDFAHRSRPALGPTQLSIQCVPVLFLGDKAAEAWR
jgi:hypothetical protein